MDLQNLRSAGEDANFSPDRALARTNPNRSILNHIALPLRPRPRFQAAEMRAMPVTTQYPAVSPIVAQNKIFQLPYRPPVSVGCSLVVYASKQASSWAGLEESTTRTRVTTVPSRYWALSGIETPMANGPAWRGQYVVTFSFRGSNCEVGRITSQRLTDDSWRLKLRNVVLMKRVAVEFRSASESLRSVYRSGKLFLAAGGAPPNRTIGETPQEEEPILIYREVPVSPEDWN